MTITPGPGYATKTMAMGTPMYTKKSMCEVTMSATDVDAEGGGVVRTLDSTLSNG